MRVPEWSAKRPSEQVSEVQNLTYDRGRNAVGTSQRDHNDDTQTTDTNGRELAGYWVSDVAHAGNSML